MPVARQFVRERPHVAGALHVVLAAQRVHADAGPADIAGQHGEVGDPITVVEPWLCSVTPRP
jgi:hypothetical protein